MKDQNHEEIEMTACTREPVLGGKSHVPTKICIVDDDDTYRSLMKHAVDRSRDLECVGSYYGGVEALKGIPSLVCEVVLVDVRMPGMNGFECTRQLKNARPLLVIIMISGFDDSDTFAKERDAGADDYWAKRDVPG